MADRNKCLFYHGQFGIYRLGRSNHVFNRGLHTYTAQVLTDRFNRFQHTIQSLVFGLLPLTQLPAFRNFGGAITCLLMNLDDIQADAANLFDRGFDIRLPLLQRQRLPSGMDYIRHDRKTTG